MTLNAWKQEVATVISSRLQSESNHVLDKEDEPHAPKWFQVFGKQQENYSFSRVSESSVYHDHLGDLHRILIYTPSTPVYFAHLHP